MYEKHPIFMGYGKLQMTEAQNILMMEIDLFCGIKEHIFILEELINIILWIENNDLSSTQV